MSATQNMPSIIRTVKNKDNPYAMIDKRPLSDKKLSWKAKGIWAYLLSKPDDWTVVIEDLINQSSDGERSVRSGLKELQENGYYIPAQERDESGQIVRHFGIVFEIPVDPNNPPDIGGAILTKRANGGLPILLFSTSGKPTSGKPTSGKRRTTNNDLTNNDLTNTKDDAEGEPHFGEVITAWESLKGSINGFISETLSDYCDEWEAYRAGLPDSHPDKHKNTYTVVKLAIHEMGLYADQPNAKYLRSVLDTWRASGVQSKRPTRTNGNGKKPVDKGSGPSAFEILKQKYG